MKVILSKTGIKHNQWGAQLKPGVVYDRIKDEGSSSTHYIKIGGQFLYCSTDADFLEVPEGCFVVKTLNDLDCYSWNVGEYLVAKKFEGSLDGMTISVLNQPHSIILRADCDVVADPWKVVPTLNYPKFITLKERVEGLTLGKTYEVKRLNVSGSFMVRKDSDYSDTPVAPRKCMGSGNMQPQQVTPVPMPCAPAVPPVAPKKRAPKLEPDILTPENKKIIKKQKALAAELLERFGFYGNAIIAGGAPRNWWFNRPANDLDIFIPAPTDFTGKNLRAIMEREGITDIYNMATHNPDGTLKIRKNKHDHTYDERMSDIHSVFEGQYYGQTVQVIWTNVSTYGYIESHFDTSINMIFSVLAADGEINIYPTGEFLDGVETGAIYVHDNQCAYANAHLEKVANYYPEVPLVWYEELSECRKDPSYVLEVAKTWEDHLQDQLDAQRDCDDCW